MERDRMGSVCAYWWWLAVARLGRTILLRGVAVSGMLVSSGSELEDGIVVCARKRALG